MATETLRIVINTVYRGGQAIDKASKDLEKLDKNTSDAERRMKTFAKAAGAVTAILAGVAVGAKLTYDALVQGAALELTKGKFDALAGSIGTTADVLLNNMRQATRGMISDADLMAGAVDLISVGIAGNAEEAIRFTNVVGRLGVDMQALTLTIVNQSKLRLDSLGLSVETVDARFQELRGTMSDEEAWKLAVLESLEDRVDLLGDTSETTAGKIARLQTVVQNLEDQSKTAVALGLTPLVEELDRLFMLLGDTTVTDFGSEFVEGLFAPLTGAVTDVANLKEAFILLRREGVDPWLATMPQMLDALRRLEHFNLDAGLAIELERRALQREALTRKQEANPAYVESDLLLRDLFASTRVYTDLLEENEANEKARAEALELSRERLEMLREAQEAATERLGDYFAAAVEAKDNTFDMNEELFRAVDAAGGSAHQLAILGVATGKFTEEQAIAALKTALVREKIDELAQLIIDKKMGIPEALAALADFQATVDAATTDVTDFETATRNLDAALRGLPTNIAIDVVTRYITEGQIGPVPVPGGSQIRAAGDPSFPGGLTSIAEFGRPELVALPQGSRIFSQNSTTNLTNNLNVTSSRKVARILHAYMRRQSRPQTVLG